ncbi:MICOS subunit MIC26 [Trichoderma ghanense]|uniref:MICOS complex subunit n=1 Tax=Trichoderma ghanense TaxID=65468 RepID=A0ABY2HBK2_9HYPO
MAARVLLQRRSFAPLAAAALGGIAFSPAVVFAEGPKVRQALSSPSLLFGDILFVVLQLLTEPNEQRKPIYDDAETFSPQPAAPSLPSLPAILPSKPTTDDDNKAADHEHSPTPTDRLAVQIGRARLFLYDIAVAAENKVNQTMDSAFDLEQSFTRTIASLAPPRESGEKLMPGAIYVLVAAMAGSIVTRNRNVVLRATVPFALGVGAGWTVLPITMRNVSDLAWKYEQKFPAVAESHVKLREGIQRGIHFAKVHKDVGVQYVDDKVTNVREAVENWVAQGK